MRISDWSSDVCSSDLRKPRETVEINLASLIDVVFILLLFFVLTTTFTRETQLKVELPEAVSGSPAEDQQLKNLEVPISAEGPFSVNNQLLPQSSLASLIDELSWEKRRIREEGWER